MSDPKEEVLSVFDKAASIRLQKFNRLATIMHDLDMYYLISRNIIDAGYIDDGDYVQEFKELCGALGVK